MRAGTGDNRFALLWLRAVFDSDLPKTTKLVLAGLVTFMDADGGNCYPSLETLAERCSLTKNGAQPHLQIAEKRGFLWILAQRDSRGKGWRRHTYEPSIPKVTNAVGRVGEMVANGVGHDQALAKDGGQPHDGGGQPDVIMAANGVGSTYPNFTYLNDLSQRSGEISEEPEKDGAGYFVITPAHPEWAPWVEYTLKEYGEKGVKALYARNPPKIVTKHRWPEEKARRSEVTRQ